MEPHRGRSGRSRAAIVAVSCAVAALAAASLTACSASHAAPWIEPVEVFAEGCSLTPHHGSGVIIDPGVAVTAAHIVAGATTIELTDRAGARHRATIAAIDTERDVAVLHGADIGGHHHRVRPLAEGESGAYVGFGAHGGSGPQHFTVLQVASINSEDIYVKGNYERPGYELAAPVMAGDSGAGLVVRGDVGGIIWSRNRNADDRGFAIAADVVLDALSRAGTEPAPAVPCT